MANFEGRKGQKCPEVDILKATQQGAELVQCKCQLGELDGVQIGANL